MGTILEDVFLGTAEKYNQKLEMLAKMAQPEKWTYKRIQDKDPYRILRNYIQYTYKRLDEEGKIIFSADGKYRCMNTGLLTVYNQEIVAIFPSMKNQESNRGSSMDFSKRRINFLQQIFRSFPHWQTTVTASRI